MAYSNPNPSNQVRIRDSGTVRELKIPRENLEELQKIVSSRHKTDEFKKQMIKKLAKASPCCVCGGIPALEISYPRMALPGLKGTVKCIERVYSREQVL